jgi:hypothetical protein
VTASQPPFTAQAKVIERRPGNARESSMKKIYCATFDVGMYSFMRPATWASYPLGVELVEVPSIECDDRGAHIRLVLRCEADIGREMGWIPLEKPETTEHAQ